MGVSKRQPVAAIAEAVAAGLTDIGESYLQEAREKLPRLPPVRKHFIGHVQTNKAKARRRRVRRRAERRPRARRASRSRRPQSSWERACPCCFSSTSLRPNASAVRRTRRRRLAETAPWAGGLAPRGRDGDRAGGWRPRRNLTRFRASCQDLGAHRWKYAFHRHVGRLARSAASWLDDGTRRRGAFRSAHRWEAPVSVFSKIGSFFSIRDDEEELYEDGDPIGTRRSVDQRGPPRSKRR